MPELNSAKHNLLMTRSSKNYLLLFIVFVCGMGSVAVEMLASRLLAPFFGTSLYIWAILIGFIMIYLSIGYMVGGRLADRYPRPAVLYQIIALAACFLALVPFISRPVLSLAVKAFQEISIGAFIGSLSGVLLLFAAPVILLAMVSPFAIRLQMNEVSGSGNTSGSIYALSTIGSIIGTFVPVFFLVPSIGTARSFLAFAIVLLLFATAGLVADRSRRAVFTSALAILVVGLLIFYSASGVFSQIKDASSTRLSIIYEGESPYNYIQVAQSSPLADGSKNTYLILNEGQAIHSWYNPVNRLTGGEWDYFLIGNYVLPAWSTGDFKRVAMIGSGAGSVPKEFDRLYGSQVYIDSVEIDPAIVDVGRRYFAMDEDTNSHIHIADGRYWLATNDGKYDMIGVDAYRQPYIPFHLTTREWFATIKDHLNPQGVAILNAGRTRDDYSIVNVVANSMRDVFKHVYLIDVPNNHGSLGNTMIIGTDAPDGIANFQRNTALIGTPGQGLSLTPSQITDLKTIATRANSVEANLREWTAYDPTTVFTDDHAPVEDVIDRLIFKYITASDQP